MPQVYTIYRHLSSWNFRKIFYPVFFHFGHVDAAVSPSHTIRRFVSDSTHFNVTNQNSKMFVRGTLLGQTIQTFIITDPQANIPCLVVLIAVVGSIGTHVSLSLSRIRHSTIYYRQNQGGNLNLTIL